MQQERLYSLDLLRFWLMSLGIVLHTYCAYITSAAISEFPIVASGSHHWIYDALVLWIHMFRMPLFFFISGFVTVRSLRGQSRSQFLRKRVQRIAVPFTVSMIVLVPVFRWSLTDLGLSKGPVSFNMTYLWFLYDLFIISFWVRAFADPLLRWARLVGENHWDKSFVALAALVTLGVYSSRDGVLATMDSWIPNPLLLLVYLGAYFWGLSFYYRLQKYPACPRRRRLALAVFGVLILSLLYLKGVQALNAGSETVLLCVSGLHGVTTVAIINLVAHWVFPMNVIRRKKAFYLGKSTYAMYLIHPIILVPSTYIFDRFGSHPSWVPNLNMLCVLVLSLGMYHVCIRNTFLDEYL